MKKATRQQTRTHNSQLILKTIYDRGQVSRAEIARLTHLTRTTVSDVVAELMHEGLVEEVGVGPSAGGKPPILLSVVDDARHLIGIDLANSEFRGAIINLRGEFRHRLNLPVAERDGDAALELVYSLIDELLAVAERPVLGIGIGSPGLMDARQGVVRVAVNLNWRDLPLGDLLEARYDLPVYIANDSQVAALAEMRFGSSKDASSVIVVRVGRGVGSGIVLNRQLHYGDNFGAGEIGHVVLDPAGELCRCGNRGCLETFVSSRALLRQARQAAEADPRSALHVYAASPGDLNIDVLFRAFQDGDPLACRLIEDAGARLGTSIANMAASLGIQRVVLAGSLARFGAGLAEPVRRALAARWLPALTTEMEVEMSALGDDIVILGTAALLLSHELGIV